MVRSDQHQPIIRELLVRYLDTWTPAALHSGRTVTYASNAGADSAIAALRVFGEFADRLAGHRLVMALTAPDPEALRRQLDTVHSELGGPAELVIQITTGDTTINPKGPLFGYAEEPVDLSTMVLGKHAELLLAVDRDVEITALPLSLRVELVDHSGQSVLLVFATAAAKHLERFKDELWAVDEYAGVRYRDPRDREGTLLDISLTPDLAPLRRAVLRLVTRSGRTVADLRAYTQVETIYRVADVNRLLPSMLTAGTLAREPERGRLTPDTVVRRP